jgi:hypothetical protein
MQRAFETGQAAEVFGEMVAELGGPSDFVDRWRDRLPAANARGALGGGDRGFSRQGHAVWALGTGRRAGALDLALFPRYRPRLSRRCRGRGLPDRRHRRHPRQQARLGHGHPRRARRRACPHRRPICYTSADSVFQIAAHEQSFRARPAAMRSARRIARHVHPLNIGRVIARPFLGTRGRLHPHPQPPRLRDPAARAHALRPGDRRPAAR